MASKKRHMIRGGTDQEDASILKLGPGRLNLDLFIDGFFSN
jgi:hypothetical protein